MAANDDVPSYNSLLERFREIQRYRGNTSRSEVMRGVFPIGTRIAAQGEHGSPWVPGIIIGYWDDGPRFMRDDGDVIMFPSWSQISQIVPRSKNAVKRTPMSRPRNSKNHLGGRRSRRRRNTKRML
jgi:hypothetical protein